MKPHTTHHDDCGCLSEKHRAEIDALRARVAGLETVISNRAVCAYCNQALRNDSEEFRQHYKGCPKHPLRLALAASQAEVRELREKLRPYVCEVDEMSWHGEAMYCALCGATWNNGEKRNEPATPETHKPECLLSRPPGDDTALREVCRKVALEGIACGYSAGGYLQDYPESARSTDAVLAVNRILGHPGDDAKEGR